MRGSQPRFGSPSSARRASLLLRAGVVEEDYVVFAAGG